MVGSFGKQTWPMGIRVFAVGGSSGDCAFRKVDEGTECDRIRSLFGNNVFAQRDRFAF